MKNIKDRYIRIDNLPKRNIVYILSSFDYRLLFILFTIGIFSIFYPLNKAVAIIVLMISLYIISRIESRVVLELCEDCLVYFEEDRALLIYYKEIINYRSSLEASQVKIVMLLEDESQVTFYFNDKKLIDELEKLIGEKYVGK